MSSEIEDTTKTAPPIEPPAASDAVDPTGPSDVGTAESDAEAAELDSTGLDESDKDDEAGAPATAGGDSGAAGGDAPAPREPGVNRPYGEPGESGNAAFRRQHKESTGEEAPRE